MHLRGRPTVRRRQPGTGHRHARPWPHVRPRTAPLSPPTRWPFLCPRRFPCLSGRSASHNSSFYFNHLRYVANSSNGDSTISFRPSRTRFHSSPNCVFFVTLGLTRGLNRCARNGLSLRPEGRPDAPTPAFEGVVNRILRIALASPGGRRYLKATPSGGQCFGKIERLSVLSF